MNDTILALIQDAMYFLIALGVGFLVAYLKKKIGVEKLRKLQKESEFIKEVVMAGVKYAEMRFETGQKLDEASQWITNRLNEKGLSVSKEEVDGLIESSLRDIKDEFGENWGEAVKK